MINIYSELVEILRINDYGCSALNETSLSTYARLRRHPEREMKECKKAGSGKSAVKNCPLH